MLAIPTQAKQLPFANSTDKFPAVLFAVKLQNKPQPVSTPSTQTPVVAATPPPPILTSPTATTTTKVVQTSNQKPSPKSPIPFFNPNTNYDCNMDQFITKMTKQGRIVWAETSSLKFLNSNNSSNNSLLKNGLLFDYNIGKFVNIYDHVHSNDHSHINQHINNGKYSIPLVKFLMI